MYQAFKDMIRELYDDQQFYQFCYINGFKTKCFVSPITDNLIYSEGGLQDGVNFSIEVNMEKLNQPPKEGDKIIFRQKTYKIASIEIDSVGTCLKLYLISTSTGA